MTPIMTDLDACVDRAIETVGRELVVMSPLGLGKPVQLLNAFYQRAERDPSVTLHIITALCLELPRAASPIEASLMGPVFERMFGDYEELVFLKPMRKETLPANVKMTEVYFKAGSMKKVATAQRNYISSNYTHIARDAVAIGANVLLQLVAARGVGDDLEISLSCNPDTSLDLVPALRARGEPFIAIGQVHDELPFMENDAKVGPDFFDLVVRNPSCNRTLFGVPNGSVPLRDYATALHASSLVRDGGTLQIGIGALGDAVAHATILRHRQNADYRAILKALNPEPGPLVEDCAQFKEGLYVSTEMFVNGMMHLIEQGVVKRKVYDNLILQRGLNEGAIEPVVDERLYDYCFAQGLLPAHLDEDTHRLLSRFGIIDVGVQVSEHELRVGGQVLPNDLREATVRQALLDQVRGHPLKEGRILHGGFFLGPQDFYRKLRELDAAGQEQICMTSVLRTNQLLLDYPLYCAQRRHARFINTGMIATLSGAVASDALQDGTVISGVGGQYNFVAMAHDLPEARSVLCIRATRGDGKKTVSNIVPFYGHTTVPRHLRDVVVTEYGVADLRGQSDENVVRRMIDIADSRFQQNLADWAMARGKLPREYRVPQYARNNTPQHLEQALSKFQDSQLLPAFPLGTELTEQELALGASLRRVKALSDEPRKFIRSAFRALLHQSDSEAARPYLERIQLEHPGTKREFLIQQLLLLELEERGHLKAG